ncbi:c-type cytochrome [Frigoriflavimonas asaccharolytica]|uniref:Cytochrome c n=1 Tax=Frigoriflavimonas asaccharolytica TaxID=2735899 RepID=A0A8J8KAW2_9FLAO|nr:c-type cytochrome [Frigoriflavimonas asaccharolytica]NRS91894.1 cytochrome c [Frigoriflavimonas asaccharolytica]
MTYKILKCICILPLIMACSEKENVSIQGAPTFDTYTEAPKIQEVAKPIDTLKLAAEGKVLIEKADCLGCHKLNETMIGPSYVDVAKKYDYKDLNYLAKKIVDGGSGVWGAVPMAAHNGLSQENSQKMVYYILSTKK